MLKRGGGYPLGVLFVDNNTYICNMTEDNHIGSEPLEGDSTRPSLNSNHSYRLLLEAGEFARQEREVAELILLNPGLNDRQLSVLSSFTHHKITALITRVANKGVLRFVTVEDRLTNRPVRTSYFVEDESLWAPRLTKDGRKERALLELHKAWVESPLPFRDAIAEIIRLTKQI